MRQSRGADRWQQQGTELRQLAAANREAGASTSRHRLQRRHIVNTTVNVVNTARIQTWSNLYVKWKTLDKYWIIRMWDLYRATWKRRQNGTCKFCESI